VMAKIHLSSKESFVNPTLIEGKWYKYTTIQLITLLAKGLGLTKIYPGTRISYDCAHVKLGYKPIETVIPNHMYEYKYRNPKPERNLTLHSYSNGIKARHVYSIDRIKELILKDQGIAGVDLKRTELYDPHYEFANRDDTSIANSYTRPDHYPPKIHLSLFVER
jgi:hypothetical protein